MAEQIERTYEERRPLLAFLRNALQSETEDTLAGLPNVDRIAFRVKDAKSFARKASDPANDPLYENPLVEIEDQVAGRVIVFFVGDIEPVLERLRGAFNAVERQHRRPARDEEFGYESYHLVCLIPPHLVPEGWQLRDDLPPTFELQVRTVFMHAYAEPQHDLGYKARGDLPREVQRELAWIAASSWGADKAYERVWRWDLANRAAG